MKLEIARQIEQAARTLGVNAWVRDDYSGRGMFGRVTVAIVMDSISDFSAAACRAGAEIGRAGGDSSDLDSEILDARTDSLGFSIVIY